MHVPPGERAPRAQRPRPSRASAGILIGVLASALAASCGGPRPEYTPPPPPEVTVAHPVQRDIPDTLEFIATIRGAREVQLRSRVAGYLQKRHTDGGQRVTMGQPLFTLDLRPFELAVREAKAIVDERTAELAEAEIKLVAEQEALTRGGSNERSLSEAQAARDVANSQLELAIARMERAKLDQEWANITAPISGRMSFARVEESDLISVNDLLATIIDDSKVYAVYDIDERTVLGLRERYSYARPGEEGRKPLVVRLARANDVGFPFQGTFYRAEAGLNPDTGTIRIEAEFDNPDGAILPGTFVRVQPDFGLRPAMLVPDLAVLSDQAGRYVLIVDDQNTVHRIPVRITGPVFERMRPVEEVIGQDLPNGDRPEPRLTVQARVIVNGLQRVRAGMEVSPAFEGDRHHADQPASAPSPH